MKDRDTAKSVLGEKILYNTEGVKEWNNSETNPSLLLRNVRGQDSSFSEGLRLRGRREPVG